MRRQQVFLGLALFGLAAVCALPAWFWEPLGISLFGSLVLWFASASFAWKGLRALLGRVDVPPEPAHGEPHPPAAPSPSPPAPAPSATAGTVQALEHAAGGTFLTVRRVQVILAWVLLAPAALLMAVWGGVTLHKGELLEASFLLGAAAFLGWYCLGALRTAWRHGGTNPL